MTPIIGTQERRELLDVMRVACEQDLGQKVIFKVDHLAVIDDWAFARVTPLRPNGEPIDYRKTKYKEAFEADMFGGLGEALLRRQYGKWRLLEWRFGATDTEIEVWRDNYRTPKGLFRGLL